MSNPVLNTIKSRRSIRRYRPEPLAQDLLETILEAGRYAPSGGNNQSCHFLVLRNKQALAHLQQLVMQEFAAMEIDETTYKSLRHSVELARKGGYDYTFSAPVLVLVANQKNYGNAMADSACALQNMMLAAAALDVGSCWVNQLRWLDGSPAIHQYLETLGLSPEETICGGLVLGYRDQVLPKAPARTGNRVTFVD